MKMVKREFEDGIVGGIEMSRETVRTRTMEKRYPSYLTVDNRENPVVLRTSDRLDPTKLRPRCAYVYYALRNRRSGKHRLYGRRTASSEAAM